MFLALDHLVILAHDLQRATAEYQAQGFVVTPGGTHADGLTHNALVVFADGTYLELIAFLDPFDTRDNVWGWRQFHAKGGGLIDYCMGTDDMERTVALLQQRGLQIAAPTSGGRKRPDGVVLQWRSARFWQAGRELPFLIQDVTPRDRRVPPNTAHPNGITGIQELMIAVADLPRLSSMFSTLLDCAPPPAVTNRRFDAQTQPFSLGGHMLTLAAPTSQHSPLQQRLETLGLGPTAVTWAAAAAPSRVPATWFGVRR